jgi:hypothetical protein
MKRFLCGSMLSALLVVTALTVPSVAQASRPGQIESAIQFREPFGLKTDRAYVSLVDSMWPVSRYGVALTPAEEADLDARLAVQEQLDPLVKALGREPSSAGVYIDQKDGGAVVVSYVGDKTAVQSKVEASALRGATIRYRQVAHSVRDLKAIAADVQARPWIWRAAGANSVKTNVDVVANKVSVEIFDPTNQGQQALKSAYGDVLEVTAGANPIAVSYNDGVPAPIGCNPAQCRAPMPSAIFGGIAIFPTPSGGRCTSGYWARNAAGNKYLVTAGHCLAEGDPSWSTGSGSIGSNFKYCYASPPPGESSGSCPAGAPPYADVGLINSSILVSAPYNQYLMYAGSTPSIRTIIGAGTPVPGASICRAGATPRVNVATDGDYWQCGVVNSDGVSIQAPSIHGDSGSVVVDANGVLYGHVVAVDRIPASTTYFQTVELDMALMGITPCVTSSCDGAGYHALTPARLVDTRVGNGISGALPNKAPRDFQVVGRGGVPGGAVAVTGNLTVVANASDYGYIYVGPYPMALPGSSTLNFATNSVVANGLTVRLSSGGTLSVTFVASVSSSWNPTVHVIFDVTGYYSEAAGLDSYFPMTPTRLMDTRIGNGLSGQFNSGTVRFLPVVSRFNIPPYATSVSGNLTVVANASGGGWVYVGPVGSPIATSNINFAPGQIVANNMTVGLGGGGLYIMYQGPAGANVQLIFDVTGYYVNGMSGLRYVPLTTQRVLDSRPGSGQMGLYSPIWANSSRSFAVAGMRGIASWAGAITGNLTTTNSTYAGWLYLGPWQTLTPGSSTLNFLKGENRANGVSVPLGGGQLALTFGPGGGAPTSPVPTTDAILDITGYFMQ